MPGSMPCIFVTFRVLYKFSEKFRHDIFRITFHPVGYSAGNKFNSIRSLPQTVIDFFEYIFRKIFCFQMIREQNDRNFCIPRPDTGKQDFRSHFFIVLLKLQIPVNDHASDIGTTGKYFKSIFIACGRNNIASIDFSEFIQQFPQPVSFVAAGRKFAGNEQHRPIRDCHFHNKFSSF